MIAYDVTTESFDLFKNAAIIVEKNSFITIQVAKYQLKARKKIKDFTYFGLKVPLDFAAYRACES